MAPMYPYTLLREYDEQVSYSDYRHVRNSVYALQFSGRTEGQIWWHGFLLYHSLFQLRSGETLREYDRVVDFASKNTIPESKFEKKPPYGNCRTQWHDNYQHTYIVFKTAVQKYYFRKCIIYHVLIRNCFY